jgi:hypothetical protein
MPKHNPICPKCGGPRIPCRKCPTCRKKYNTSYYASNKDILSPKQTKRQQQCRREALAAYGGCCECCGEQRFEFLAIDHINGG